MKKKAIVVFVREPEAGVVKTRLQKSGLSAEYVLNIYKSFIQDVVDVALEGGSDQVFIYSAFHKQRTHFLDMYKDRCVLRYQEGEHLGERMHNAFMDCFLDGFTDVVLIGSDCLMLRALDFAEAFASLDHFDCCLGPSDDGGYYLIALKEPHRKLFEEPEWGTERVFEQTIAKALFLDLDVEQLGAKRDVDTVEDLIYFLKTSPEDYPAHQTRNWIKQNPLPIKALT